MWKRSRRQGTMDCRKVEASLVAYLKDGLSPARRQAMDDHLAVCDTCRRSLQQAQVLESELRVQAVHHNPTLSTAASARIGERVYRRMRRGLIMQRAVKSVRPSWAQEYGVYSWVPRGRTYMWEGSLKPGIHTMVCGPDLPVPVGGWFMVVSDTPTEAAVPSPVATEPAAAEPLYQSYDIGEDLFTLVVADLDGDAHPDIAATDLDSDQLKLLLNQGDGSFQVAAEMSTGEDPRGLVAADLDGDSDLDLVVAHAPIDKPGTLSVLLNEGDGTFRESAEYATVDNWFVTAVDLDGDTDLDLVIEDGTGKGPGTGDFGARILLNDGDGTFQEGERYFDLRGIGNVVVGDLDNDTFPDLVVRRYPEPEIRVYLGKGDGTFGEPADYETSSKTVPELRWIVVADLNGDQYADVAAVNFRGVVSVLFNQGDGTLLKEAELDVGGEPWLIDAIDVDGDTFLDLMVAPTGSGNLSLLTNDGAGGFELTKDYYYKGAWVADWVVRDVNGDGKRDLVGIDGTSVHVLEFEDGD